MTGGVRWSAVVLAGLCWIFLTRLGLDMLAPRALHPTLIAPPLIVAALRLPARPGAVTLALVALLYDAALGIPFGLSATIALPLHFLLIRLRNHFPAESPFAGAMLALAITPVLHIGTALALTLGGKPFPVDLPWPLVEIAIGAVASALATPWLDGLTLALLRLFGVRLEKGEVVP